MRMEEQRYMIIQVLAFMLILSGQTLAMDNINDPVTEPPPYAAYEIIQTSRALRLTYLLITYSVRLGS